MKQQETTIPRSPSPRHWRRRAPAAVFPKRLPAWGLFGLVSGFMLLSLSRLGAAYTPRISASVSAGASAPLVASVTVEARNISNDQPAGWVSFGQVSGMQQLAQQYVRITFRANLLAWGMSIHSNNVEADEQLKQQSRAGGLLNQYINTVVMPIGWQAHNDIRRPPPFPGDPSIPGSGWRYMKDINDADWGRAGGYRNVAFGGGDYANIVPPLGDPVPNRTGFFHVYPEAVGVPVIGPYSGSLIFDIYTE